MRATGSRHRQWVLGVALWAGATLLTGCASHPSATIASGGNSSTSASVATAPNGPLALGDADNGTSATMSVGQRVTVTLASTYWQFGPPSAEKVLSEEGQPVSTPGGPSCSSIPGTGCGTVVASFTALAPGDADLAADRTACGEALRCSEAQAHWRVHVHISGPAPSVPPVAVTTTAPPASTSASTTVAVAGAGGTGLQGTVLFSPVCPVERIPPDPACAPRPGAALIDVQRADGGPAAEVTAGPDGRFTVSLAPGQYKVTATASTPGPGRGCQVEPPQVTVSAGAYVPVSVSCDTGIR